MNAAPNEFVWLALTPQPWFPVCETAQLVPPTRVPVIAKELLSDVGIVHPGLVWIVAWLFV